MPLIVDKPDNLQRLTSSVLLTNDGWSNDLRGLPENHFLGECFPVDNGVPAQFHGTLSSGQRSNETAFPAKSDRTPGSKNVKKYVVPLNAARQDNPAASGQRKLLSDVENEGGG